MSLDFLKKVCEKASFYRAELKYFVDMYKVGKLNNYQGLDKQIDWADFGAQAISKLKKYRKDFYIKKDLFERLDSSVCLSLKPENTDADFWALKGEPAQGELI